MRASVVDNQGDVAAAAAQRKHRIGPQARNSRVTGAAAAIDAHAIEREAREHAFREQSCKQNWRVVLLGKGGLTVVATSNST